MMSYAEVSIDPPRRAAPPLLLVAEITHRVVNEYTQAICGLRLAAASAASIEAREALVDAANRLLQFATAHRALQAPVAVETVDLSDVLERLCDALSLAALNETGARLTLVCEPVLLDAARCWRTSLIVSELITNAVRHGLRNRPGEICVRVGLFGDEVRCQVSDNGRADPEARPALGSQVVNGLTVDLGGRLERVFGANGARVTLTFPRDSDGRFA